MDSIYYISVWSLYIAAKELNADKLACYELMNNINQNVGNKFFYSFFNRIKTDIFTYE